MKSNPKNIFIYEFIFITCVFVVLIYFVNLFNSKLESKHEQDEKIYKLDYKLEDDIVTTIESDGIVNIEKLVKIKFYKMGIYSSYFSLQDLSSYIEIYNTSIPKEGFNYIFFFDENNNIVKVTVLNKKYDILEGKSYKEYISKNTVFKFRESNIKTYMLENPVEKVE